MSRYFKIKKFFEFVFSPSQGDKSDKMTEIFSPMEHHVPCGWIVVDGVAVVMTAVFINNNFSIERILNPLSNQQIKFQDKISTSYSS